MEGEELIRLLVHFSRHDGHFDEKEFVYILNVADRIGLSHRRTEEIIKNPGLDELTVPSSEHERMRLFYYFLFLMKIDKVVNDKEAELIHHYGFKLGFSRSMVNDFIDIIRTHEKKEIPTNLMIEVIKKYQN